MLEKIEYGGWLNCYRFANDSIQVVMTGDVGPRIIHLCLPGQENIFHINREDQGNHGGILWRHYGGHRMWHGPEVKPRTYYPDNWPIQVIGKGNLVHLIQQVEETTGMQKEIELLFDPHEAHIKVTHRLRNTTPWSIKEIAIWALSDMSAGGIGIMPLPERIIHDPEMFQPPHPLVLWDYTDMSDPRWTWGQRFILLRDSAKIPSHQKVGMVVPEGWVAYVAHNNLFVKKFAFILGARYPDGCSGILFTNAAQSQLESKSQVMCLNPKSVIEYVEDWYLFDNVPLPQNDADVDQYVIPKIKTILS